MTPSVPVILASATLWNSGPKMGGLRINRSHFRRPSSVLIHFFTPITVPTITAMTTKAQALVMIDETLMRTWVGKGSLPPRVLNSSGTPAR